MNRRTYLIVAVLMSLAPTGRAMGVTATLTADAFTVSTSATSNKGGKPVLEVSGPSGGPMVDTAYVQFSLSTLPMSVTASDIAKATLTVFVNKVGAAGSFDVQRVTGTWTESTITAGTTPSLGTVEQSAVAVGANDKNQFKVIDVTNVVKAWRDGSLANNGLALVANAVDGLDAKFDSKESTSHSQVPRLEITLSSSAGAGTVTSVTAAGPLSVTNPTTTPNLTLGTVPISLGGTNATTAAGARSQLGAAAIGSNIDITSLSGITGNISMPQSTSASSGNIEKGGVSFLHNRGGTFLGLGAGNFSTTGFSNTGVGDQSLESVTSGFRNNAVGTQSMELLTTGYENTAIGNAALRKNSTGNFNTAVGAGALDSTTSSDNTAIGHLALVANTTGSANTAVGLQTLFSNTTGSNNTAIGITAGMNQTTGSDNIYVGNQGVAAEGNTTRIGNVQTRAFVAGIRGVTTATADAVPVLIDSSGQLGTGPVVTSPLAVTGLASTVTTSSSYVFLGSPTAYVSLVPGQKVAGVATAALGKTAVGTQSIRIDLCSQDSTTAITPLFNTSNFLIVELDNGPRRAVTVSNYRAAIAAETYRFGFCVASNSTPVTLDRNDWVNGWVTITN